jgi:hypothetical protein
MTIERFKPAPLEKGYLSLGRALLPKACVCAAFLFTACGAPPTGAPPLAPSSSAPLAASPPLPTAEEAAAPAEPEQTLQSSDTTQELPQNCADSSACYPPPRFTEAVCRKKFPDLPLHLFGKRMPWQHLYVKAEHVEPVNAHGGEQSEAWMKFGEELLVLGRKGPGSGKGLQMSGPTDLDVLRWDGTCATIREEMLVSYVPAPMQSPRIIWKYLSAEAQEALLKSAAVARAKEQERKNCKNSSVKYPTETCAKAMQKLTDAIVVAVHQGIELPVASALPAWTK